MIVGDNLAKVEPKLLEGGIASGLFLKFGKANLPFWLAPTVLSANFI